MKRLCNNLFVHKTLYNKKMFVRDPPMHLWMWKVYCFQLEHHTSYPTKRSTSHWASQHFDKPSQELPRPCRWKSSWCHSSIKTYDWKESKVSKSILAVYSSCNFLAHDWPEAQWFRGKWIWCVLFPRFPWGTFDSTHCRYRKKHRDRTSCRGWIESGSVGRSCSILWCDLKTKQIIYKFSNQWVTTWFQMELNRSCKPPWCLNFTAWNDETTRLLLSMWKILSATLSFFSSCLGGFGPNVFCCQKRTRVKSENINSSQWRHMTWTYFMEDISDYFCHLPLAWPPHKPHLTILAVDHRPSNSLHLGSTCRVTFANHKVGEFISSSTCSGHLV